MLKEAEIEDKIDDEWKGRLLSDVIFKNSLVMALEGSATEFLSETLKIHTEEEPAPDADGQ